MWTNALRPPGNYFVRQTVMSNGRCWEMFPQKSMPRIGANCAEQLPEGQPTFFLRLTYKTLSITIRYTFLNGRQQRPKMQINLPSPN